MAGNDGRYRCPACGVEAEVSGRNIKVSLVGPSRQWPRHHNCELAKPMPPPPGSDEQYNSIDFSKLQKVG